MWLQLANVTLDDLSNEQQERIMEIADERPNDFVYITDGDASLTKAVDLSCIHTPEQLIDAIEDGEIRHATVVVSQDLYGHDFFLDYAYDIRRGYWKGTKTCYLEYPLQEQYALTSREDRRW